MQNPERKKLSLIVTVVLAGLNVLAFNVLLSSTGTPRLDVTEARLYSISGATERLLDSLEDDVTIYGYFSERTHPKLAPLIPEIEDLLEEYAAASDGRVRVEMIDPGEDEQAEQRANQRFGVSSTPFQLASKYETGIVNAYFSLVVQFGDQYERYGFEDLIEVEPLPAGDIDVRLRDLEYDLTRAIKKVVYGFRGTATLFEQIDEPVRFTAVITPDSLPETFRGVPEAVRTAAEQLQEEGGEEFVYEEIDPHAQPGAADRVRERFGAGPLVVGLLGTDEFYLYGFLEVGDSVEQLPLAEQGVTAAGVREAIENALRRHTPGFLKTVGVVAPDRALPPEVIRQYRMQGMQPPQQTPEFRQLISMLERDFAVREIDLERPDGVPVEVDTLLVVKPRQMSEEAVYNLDQYVMRGGRVILCIGQYEIDLSQRGLGVTSIETGLGEWLDHLGVRVDQTLVLDERNRPLPIPEVRTTPLGRVREWRYEPYPYLLEVRDAGIVDRRVAAGLDAVGLYWASPVEVGAADDAEAEEPGTSPQHDYEVIELLRSSPLSWTDDSTDRVSRVAYAVPEEGTQSRTLAVALMGRFQSYYAGKAPPSSETDADAEDDDGEEGPAPPTEVPLERSPDTRIAVIGNAEFLSDFVAQALGRQESGFFLQNLTYVQNLIDWINLDSDLLEIRARSTAPRRLVPLERGSEVTIEIVNYLFPIAVLALIGGIVVWRRARGISWLDGPQTPEEE
jgi:ABC-2 type transport system permease protein